jgi:GNAT superfamily N-acetyltransferase
MAVLPEYQRQGIGRLLMGYGLSRLAELGFDTLSLIVSLCLPKTPNAAKSLEFREGQPYRRLHA